MKRAFTFGTAAALTIVLHAAPVDPIGETPFRNPTASRVFIDTDNKSRLWVLPPDTGKATIPVLSMETPESTCSEMKNLFDSLLSYSRQIKTLADQRENLVKRLATMSDKSTQEAVALYTQTAGIDATINAVYKNIDALAAGSAKNHGGTLLIPYVHSGPADINRLKVENPNFPDVVPADTVNARLYFSVPGSVQDGADLANLPIITTYNVAGVKADALANSKAQIASRLDVTLSLTRMGACLMKYPAKFGVKTDPKFGLTLIYEHERAFRSTVSASYNLKNIYKFLTESGTKGGFFDSSSWSKTIESNWGESALKFNWAETDPESKLTFAQRREMEESVKQWLLASIDKLILARSGLQPAQGANPGPHGATLMAEGLEKTCATNGYCAAAAVALRVLDATFGSSILSVEVDKRLDVTATYDSSTSNVRYVPRGITYAGD